MNLIRNAFDNVNYFTTGQVYQLLSTINSQAQRFSLAKLGYKNVVDGENYDDLNALITSRARRNELAAFVEEFNLDHPGHVGGSRNMAMRVPMTSTRFNEIYLSARQQWSASARVDMIEEAFENENNYFTSTQATQLISLAGTEADRLRLAKMSWSRVTDQANYRLYYDVLESTTSRNEFNSFINTGSAFLPVTTPMPDASFKQIYERISNSWGFGVKMNLLTEVFNDPVNYFTVAQAEKLIRLVSAEYNRLALAKSSYDNIVDKENFSQLHDMFDSQASVNELNSYVNSYSYNR